MKKTKLYLLIISLCLIYFGCDKPAPTELIQDPSEDQLEIEIVTKDPEDPSSSNGFDTTGVTTDYKRFTNFILVNGTKVTAGPFTEEVLFAQAVFFNKQFPVFNNGILIGYNTVTPGILKVNNFTAKLLPFKVKYRRGGINADTTLGLHYVLFNRGRRHNNDFLFNYGSTINFNFSPFIGTPVDFNFLTPPEVFASVNITGRRIAGNLRAVVEWNSSDLNKIDIVIGGIRGNSHNTIPLFRIRTHDDGKVIIPFSLLNKIPQNTYNKLVFSLIRKIEYLHNENNTELFLLSQSIHTIIIDIP
jgi:hypothetical protein